MRRWLLMLGGALLLAGCAGDGAYDEEEDDVKTYQRLGEQTDFTGGVNRGWRNRYLPGQVSRLENLRPYPDRLEKMPGYGTLYAETGTITTCPEVLVPATYGFYACPSTTTYRVRWSTGTKADVVWASAATDPDMGTTFGLEVTPGSVLVAGQGGGGVGYGLWLIDDTVTPPVGDQWNAIAGVRVDHMAVWDDRLWVIENATDGISYTGRIGTVTRPNWATDVLADWETLDVAGYGRARMFAVVRQNLFVFFEKAIVRIDYVGGDAAFAATLVTQGHGIVDNYALTPVRGHSAVVFMDLDGSIAYFDGDSVTTLSGEENIKGELDGYDFRTDVWFAYLEHLDAVQFGMRNTTSVGQSKVYEVRLPNKYFSAAAFYEVKPHVPIGTAVWGPYTGYERALYYARGVDGTGDARTQEFYLVTDTYNQYAGNDFTAMVEFAPLDLSQLALQKGGYEGYRPHLRQLRLEASTFDSVTLTITHRDLGGTGAFSAGRDVPLAVSAFNLLTVGIDRPGRYPQVRITDGGTGGPWSLRRIEYSGLVRKITR